MTIQTITMPRAEAREKFLEYRRAVRSRHQQEDDAIMRGYRALSQGHALIDLPTVLKRGGLDHRHVPRLAICRADKPMVYGRWLWSNRAGNVHLHNQFRFSFGVESPWWRATTNYMTFTDLFPPLRRESNAPALTSWQAIVPSIPPALRPKAALSNYHILWEAEWSEVKTPPNAPYDPYLIRRLGGSLWVVLAQWDLTELERAVIAERSV